MSMLPPRKRERTPGTLQVGVFLRTAKGSVIEMMRDRATEQDQVLALALIAGGENLPAAVVEAVKAAYDAHVELARRRSPWCSTFGIERERT